MQMAHLAAAAAAAAAASDCMQALWWSWQLLSCWDQHSPASLSHSQK
jgi:hypothetical protein